MTTDYIPDDAPRGRGALPVPIPEDIAAEMERTYATNTIRVLPAQQDNPDDQELARLASLYARRQGKSPRIRWVSANEAHGEQLHISMRDKRPYTKTRNP